jgi:hypothetical protein
VIRAVLADAWILVFTVRKLYREVRIRKERSDMLKTKIMLAALLATLSMGCAPLFIFGAGAAAGVAGYKYYQGALRVIFQASFMDTWDASIEALENLKIEIKSSNHDATSGMISGRYADNTPVSVSLRYKTSKETEAVIRVGPLGDQKAADKIKEAIRTVLFGA